MTEGEQHCRACRRTVDDTEPVLLEFIADGQVDSIVVTPDEPVKLPPGAALVDVFHPHCYADLVANWERRGHGSWSGHCPLTRQRIVAPHPMTSCPICGASLISALLPSG